jgi:hypothetical protein
MLREAIRRWPELTAAHTALGITFKNQYRHEAALAAFTKLFVNNRIRSRLYSTSL